VPETLPSRAIAGEGNKAKTAQLLPWLTPWNRPEVADYLRALQALHLVVQPARYLEIGVQIGSSLAISRAPSVGIDPDLICWPEVFAGKPWLKLYQTESDRFFAQQEPLTTLDGQRVELAFIDGLHRFEQVLRDFINVERWSSTDGVIVLHDILPPGDPTRTASRTPSLPGMWVGDVWKMVPSLRTYRPDLRLDLLDASPSGLLVISHLDPGNTALAHRYDEIIAWWVDRCGDCIDDLESYLRVVEISPLPEVLRVAQARTSGV
jgi:hypothetical protein